MVKKIISLIGVTAGLLTHAGDWQPVAGSMLTSWGEKLKPDSAWREYPRPQLQRPQWVNLNGLWNYAITPKDAAQPSQWADTLLVPFALEAPLSGAGKQLQPDQALWYQRSFKLAAKPSARLLLHFEAVDYEAHVWVNGAKIGSHIGGNLPFSLDITSQVKPGDNDIVMRVFDATDAPRTFQLHGKQKLDNKGIWYTRVSGIWQTVWLEEVPNRYISNLKIQTDAKGAVKIQGVLAGDAVAGEQLKVSVLTGGQTVANGQGKDSVHLAIKKAKLWSPATPHLYDLKVELLDASGKVLDTVTSYAGLREVGRAKDAAGNWRFTLNGKPIFHWGPLDQGWWPDGLLTPPTDEAMVSDIRFLKEAGFNMIRKHIKVEPRRYYYHCDQLGMLVWQDQVSGGTNPEWTRLANPETYGKKKAAPKGPLDAEWPDPAHAQWMTELKGMVDHLYNAPSIVVWTPFNECWGQHRSIEVGKWIAGYDPSRLINIASGGNFFPVGDVADEHRYPHPGFPLEQTRFAEFIKVVGEFGGHGWPVEGHLWNKEKRNWGYGGLPTAKDEYVERYRTSIRMLSELKAKGISAGVYTQTTDVEGEINGLLTYDRKVNKIPVQVLADIHRQAGLLD